DRHADDERDPHDEQVLADHLRDGVGPIHPEEEEFAEIKMNHSALLRVLVRSVPPSMWRCLTVIKRNQFCNLCCLYGNRRSRLAHMTAAKTPNAAGNKRLNAAGLRRDLQLLDVLGSPESSQTGGLGVLRVAELVGRDKAIVSRSLATLAESGLVERDPQTGLYRLGHRLYSLAARTFESTLARTSLPYLRRLVAALHETTHLCVLRGGSVLTLLSEVSDYNFRGLGWEGVSVPALHTSSGRVL